MSKKSSKSIDWRSFFIQTGSSGSEIYKRSINKTVEALGSMFEIAGKPYSGVAPEQLQRIISASRPGSASAESLEAVIDDVIAAIAKNSVILQHPNCIAHLHCPPLIPALAAETIIACLNQSLDSWDQAPSATYTEIELIDWLNGFFLPNVQSGGVFTSGGTQSNFMGLLLARDAFIETVSGESVQEQGLPSYAGKLRIVCSGNSHFSICKSAAILGLGQKSVIPVNTTPEGEIDLRALSDTLERLRTEGLMPFVIVATAGTTDHGAIDPLESIGEVARRENLWLHVDAAYGGALMFCKHKAKLAGIESADSITVDFHKMFYQPISCGAFLLKNEDDFRYLKLHASYLNRETDDVPNLVTTSLATTRRFDALKLLVTFRTLGMTFFGQMLEQVFSLVGRATLLLAEYPQFEMRSQPQLSTILFRYIRTDESRRNDVNRRLRKTLLETGEAVLGETKIDGKVYLKLTILNPCLQETQIKALFERISHQVDLVA